MDAGIHLLDVDYDRAVENNHQLRHPSIEPKEREGFFNMIREGKTFEKSVAFCHPKFYVKQNVKKALIKLNIMRGGYDRLRDLCNAPAIGRIYRTEIRIADYNHAALLEGGVA